MTNDKTVTMSRELSPEAYSVMLGMVEHCLNIRACMGMDEGFKDFDTEEEHDFVKELRALLAAPVVERQPDAILEGCMTSVGITTAIYASTVSLKDKEQVKLFASPPAPVSVVLPSGSDMRALITKAARVADLTSGANYYTAAEFAALAFLDKVKELNQ